MQCRVSHNDVMMTLYDSDRGEYSLVPQNSRSRDKQYAAVPLMGVTGGWQEDKSEVEQPQ